MRIGMVSCLCAFLLWIFSPRSVIAQISPPGEQKFSSVKLFELPNLPVSNRAGFRTDSAESLKKMRQFDRQIRPQQKTVGPFGTQLRSADSLCARILIYRPPAVDSKMVLGVPREYASNTPRLDGLQACPGDVRGLMFSPQRGPFDPLTPLDPKGALGLQLRGLLEARP